ncbi:MAG: SCP2 sterol-binding domain-containing protein [Candidatus Sericytochromatia bacterium]|nr:SCP2 sterol-binding domain-containing protein [Candidatus Sericytochromatia bacterium]
MPVFENSQILESILYNFFLELVQNKSISDKLLAHKVTLRFNYSEPDLSIFIDCKENNQPQVFVNKNDLEPEIDLSMSADTAHKFWLGKVNLVAAITQKKISVKGSIPKLLMLLPAISPAYKMYPEYLKRIERQDLL